MLKRLQISNLAILENIDVTFQDGFTVLSGETGAGKSLIIDSLSLLLGTRAYSEWIRAGEEKALVRGEFQIDSPKTKGLLSKAGIDLENGLLVIERVLSRTKSVVRINGASASLSELSRIAPYLADIHSQFDFGKILDPSNYLSMIDLVSPGKTEILKADYRAALAEYRDAKERYESIVARKRKIEEDRDFYAYQYGELKAANLVEGEEEEIQKELSLLKNYDKIHSLAEEAREEIESDFLDRLYELGKTLDKLSRFQKDLEDIQSLVDERYYELEDAFSTLKKKFRNMDYDPSRLDELEQRESDLSSLKRKYKKSIPELIAYRDSLAESLGENASLEDTLQEAQKTMENALQKTLEKGKDLSLYRQELGKSIEKEIRHHLKDLLLDAAFEVRFFADLNHLGESDLKEDGIDAVDFYIEPNPGEGMKSLSRIASGGEASRIMLAFKALFLKSSGVSTIILDEIDTGISGEAASKVASKIAEISLSTQVIAISHTPQVAARSDHHLLIEKSVSKGRTSAHVKVLGHEEKIKAIATLIAGKNPTEKQMEAARDMVLTMR